MKRIAILCPGRGSYTERSLSSLPAGDAWVARADRLREERGLIALSQLDQAGRFSQHTHLRPSNVSPLIWLVSMLDARAARASGRAVCVAGNSMGWYTALGVAGALDFDDAFRLVQDMSLLQEEAADPGSPATHGGQVIYPIVGDDWVLDPAREEAVRSALDGAPGEAFPSIALGGYAVLAGSEAGLAHLLRALPPLQWGSNRYPLRLVQHGPYHTPLLEPVARAARARLADLRWKRPEVPLIDGRGACVSPWSGDVDALAEYTLGAQVVTPYDFAASVKVALREFAPEELVLPGPGNTLGGVCGQILVAEGWKGIVDKVAFERCQNGEAPLVRSMRR